MSTLWWSWRPGKVEALAGREAMTLQTFSLRPRLAWKRSGQAMSALVQIRTGPVLLLNDYGSVLFGQNHIMFLMLSNFCG